MPGDTETCPESRPRKKNTLSTLPIFVINLKTDANKLWLISRAAGWTQILILIIIIIITFITIVMIISIIITVKNNNYNNNSHSNNYHKNNINNNKRFPHLIWYEDLESINMISILWIHHQVVRPKEGILVLCNASIDGCINGAL